MKITLETIRRIIMEELSNTIEEHKFSRDFVGPTEELYLFFNTTKDKSLFKSKLDQYIPYDPIDKHCGDDSGTLDKDIVYISVKFRDDDSFVDAIRFFSSSESSQTIKQSKGEKISSIHDRSMTQQKAPHLRLMDRLHKNAKEFTRRLNAFVATELKSKKEKNDRIKPYGMLLTVKCGEILGNFIKYNNIRLRNKK